MAWTFEMRFPGESLWRKSAKRADTIQEAADFMAAWLVICCENALMVEVRLTQDHSLIDYEHMSEGECNEPSA